MSSEAELQSKKQQLLRFKQDYANISYGNVAFLEGKFEKPDEIFVSLGAEYFAKYDTKEAIRVLDRRARMVEDMLRDVEDELEIFEITKKLNIFQTIEDTTSYPEDEEKPIDIREELTPEEEKLLLQKKGRTAHMPVKTEFKTNFKVEINANPLQREPIPGSRSVPGHPVAVKERVLERKPTSKPIKDPLATASVKQARESLFKREMRRSAQDEHHHQEEAKETFSPNA